MSPLDARVAVLAAELQREWGLATSNVARLEHAVAATEPHVLAVMAALGGE